MNAFTIRFISLESLRRKLALGWCCNDQRLLAIAGREMLRRAGVPKLRSRA